MSRVRRPWRRRGVRLGVRLALLSAAMTAVVVCAALSLLSVRTRATTRALITDQVTQGQRTLLALQRRGDQQFVAAAALLAASPNLRSALATTRVEGALGDAMPALRPDGHADLARTVRRELERLAPDLGRDLVGTTDERGRLFAAYVARPEGGPVDDEPALGADLSALPAVRHALDPSLDGGPSALYLSVLRVGDHYFRVAVAPLVLDGFTIGTVLLGERLDEAHLRALQRSFGGELLLAAGGRVIVATAASPRDLAADVAATTHADTSEDAPPRLVPAGGEEYVAASLAEGSTQQGAPVRLTLLHAVTPTLRRATQALLLQFVAFGLVAVAAVGLGAALLARRVMEPLDAFVRHLRASVGPGDGAHAGTAGVPDDAQAAIEIRWLHLSFARLMASLARKRVQLTYQAFHDPLTGLANRVRFRAEVERALARRTGAPGDVAVLFLDLDHFKTVNDSLGHDVGDQLLVEVARRLQHATRGCDIVARLGGDEFAVLLDRVRTDADLLPVIERILRVMRTPVTLERAEVLVGASIGAARAVTAEGPEVLLRNADVAMFRAKQRGRGGYELFAPAMHAAVLERLELEADLRRALAAPETELRVVYQPIVALDGGRVMGFEALVRWDHPTRGTISPAQFIPVAEATGLVIPLGTWVLRTACRQAAAWASGAPDAPYVSVNLSARQLEDAALEGEVAAAIADVGLESSRLLLEITESVLMQRADAALRTLRALRLLGVQLAIDDFGTGYSSLAYLQRFPVDVLKIDKTFVDDVARGGAAAALARGIVALAATLGLRCVAEGIEHAEQAAELRAVGCAFGQGFLFARPLPADEASALAAATPSAVR